MCAGSVNIDGSTLSSVKTFVLLKTKCQNLIVAFEKVTDGKWRSVCAVYMSLAKRMKKSDAAEGVSCGNRATVDTSSHIVY